MTYTSANSIEAARMMVQGAEEESKKGACQKQATEEDEFPFAELLKKKTKKSRNARRAIADQTNPFDQLLSRDHPAYLPEEHGVTPEMVINTATNAKVGPATIQAKRSKAQALAEAQRLATPTTSVLDALALPPAPQNSRTLCASADASQSSQSAPPLASA